MVTTNKYLHFVNFSRFLRWDVKAYAFLQKEFDNAVLLQDILTPYDVPLSREEMIDKGWSIISKINFAGKLFLRKPEETKTFKGSLHKVDGNTLIYSKINVRHGCVYYHPDGTTPFGVSSEYPAYKIDKNRVNGEFLVLLLQSQYFKDALSARTSGISKARVKPRVFLTVNVPLPSIEEQNKIIAAYNTAIANADRCSQLAQNIDAQIVEYLQGMLGLAQTTTIQTQNTIGRYIKLAHFKDIQRWDIYNVREMSLGKYESVHLSEIINKLSTGTTPPTNNKEYFEGKIDFYTPADITGDMYLGDAERHISKCAVEDKRAHLFNKGDLLFVGIGSTVGKVGIVAKEIASSNQQITGITFKSHMILPEYAFVYMHYFKDNTTIEQSMTTIPIINQEKIRKIRIPLPPLNKQKEIVACVSDLRAEQKNLQQKAYEFRSQAQQQFERTIFN